MDPLIRPSIGTGTQGVVKTSQSAYGRQIVSWTDDQKQNFVLLTPNPQPLTPLRPKQHDCDQHATTLNKSTCDIHNLSREINLASEFFLNPLFPSPLSPLSYRRSLLSSLPPPHYSSLNSPLSFLTNPRLFHITPHDNSPYPARTIRFAGYFTFSSIAEPTPCPRRARSGSYPPLGIAVPVSQSAAAAFSASPRAQA